MEEQVRNQKDSGLSCLVMIAAYYGIVMDDEVFILFTGSGVLIHQIETCADKKPFECTISKFIYE